LSKKKSIFFPKLNQQFTSPKKIKVGKYEKIDALPVWFSAARQGF